MVAKTALVAVDENPSEPHAFAAAVPPALVKPLTSPVVVVTPVAKVTGMKPFDPNEPAPPVSPKKFQFTRVT